MRDGPFYRMIFKWRASGDQAYPSQPTRDDRRFAAVTFKV